MQVVPAKEFAAHAYYRGIVVIDRPGMESRVFFFDKYTQGQSVELANLIENHCC